MNINSLHHLLEHMRENVKQRCALFYKKPQDEKKEKEESEKDREKTIEWNQLSSILLYENESDNPMSSRMQNELQYSQSAHNDMKLDNVMHNEGIAVLDQALWEVWLLTGRHGHLFSQLMKNNINNAYMDRIRMMELSKLLRPQRNSNVGLTSSILQDFRRPTATCYHPFKTRERWALKLEKYNVMSKDDCRNKLVPLSTPLCFPSTYRNIPLLLKSLKYF